MDVHIAPGNYVVAVSGGVDSMVLLYALARQMVEDKGLEPPTPWRLTVAHFDHGIRTDSAEDRKLVQQVAAQLGLPFIYIEGKLGPGASEALARERRYAFLRDVLAQTGGQAIITAHHEDDLLETVIINLLRGTGRRGLSSLKSHDDVLRPLLHMPKQELVAYARAHHIPWREDSTNQDPSYLRNYVRLHIVPRLQPERRLQLLQYARRAGEVNETLDAELALLLAGLDDEGRLPRQFFIQLPHTLAREVLAAWLRQQQATFDRRSIERLVVFAKTAEPGKRADIDARFFLEAGKKDILLRSRTLAH